MSEKSLIIAEKLDAVALYTEGGMNVILTEIEAKVKAFIPDVSTEDSRKEITSFAYKITRSKTLLDNLGKEMVAEWKAKSKKVDAVRKEARDFCDALKAEVRKPLDEWEEKERKRKEEEERQEKERIQARVNELAKYGKNVPFFDIATMTDEEYEAEIAKAKGEHEAEQARIAKEEADRKAENERLEKEKAELERQRAEQAAVQKKIDEENRKIREAQKAAQRKIEEEKAALEAEKRKEQERKDREELERQAKIKAELEAKEKAERDEQERINRERKEAEEKKRQEGLRPDIDKLTLFAASLVEMEFPKLKSQKAREIVEEVIERLVVIANYIRQSAKEL